MGNCLVGSLGGVLVGCLAVRDMFWESGCSFGKAYRVKPIGGGVLFG